MIEIIENEKLKEQLAKTLREPYDNTEDERIEEELERKKKSGEPWTDIEW